MIGMGIRLVTRPTAHIGIHTAILQATIAVVEAMYSAYSSDSSADRERKRVMFKIAAMIAVIVLSMAAKADYWMTFCKTPGGQQYSQVGYAQPDADGFVTIKAGPLTVVVYKTQVWYQKMPGEAPRML